MALGKYLTKHEMKKDGFDVKYKIPEMYILALMYSAVAYLTHGDYISKSRQSAAWMKINFTMWKYASKRNEKRLLENLLFPPFSHGTQKF